jgi:hypothetical protein
MGNLQTICFALMGFIIADNRKSVNSNPGKRFFGAPSLDVIRANKKTGRKTSPF